MEILVLRGEVGAYGGIQTRLRGTSLGEHALIQQA